MSGRHERDAELTIYLQQSNNLNDVDSVVAIRWALDDFTDEDGMRHSAVNSRNLLVESFQRLHD